jgi:hypothetical protein
MALPCFSSSLADRRRAGALIAAAVARRNVELAQES